MVDERSVIAGGGRMSCNGCRILRRGCSDDCLLRPCLEWIECPAAQAHATLFVAKFFGRAGLASFISGVPLSRRPALFRSLLYEACGRTINPVTGAVGLLWAGNWHLCQEAVEAVLRGGSLLHLAAWCQLVDASTEAAGTLGAPPRVGFSSFTAAKRRRAPASEEDEAEAAACHLDLCLSSQCAGGGREEKRRRRRRLATPSMNSEGSVTTAGGGDGSADHPRLLNLLA